MSLQDYLKQNKIVGIEHIDTRVVRHIRDKGAMRAGISTIELNPKILLEKASESPGMANRGSQVPVTVSQITIIRLHWVKYHIAACDLA
jgi:carbamoyl-phosphate synthase small subunit